MRKRNSNSSQHLSQVSQRSLTNNRYFLQRATEENVADNLTHTGVRSRMITAPAFITQNRVVYNAYEHMDGRSMSDVSLC